MEEPTIVTINWPLADSKTLAKSCSMAMVVYCQDVANSARSRGDVTTQQTLLEQQVLPEGRDQNWGKRRAEEEEKQEKEEGEEGEEIDILAYPPPEALTQFPNSTPETIRMVIQTALENTTQHIRIEKEKVEEAAARRDADSRRAEAEDVKGKGKGKAIADLSELTTPSIQVIDVVTTAPEPGTAATTGDDGSLKSPGRPRFGLRRIFHHLVEKGETNGKSSAAGSVDAQNHSVSSSAGSVVEIPSPFTQFIYKHMHAKLAQSSDQGSEEK
jgi:hypothetical protein